MEFLRFGLSSHLKGFSILDISNGLSLRNTKSILFRRYQHL